VYICRTVTPGFGSCAANDRAPKYVTVGLIWSVVTNRVMMHDASCILRHQRLGTVLVDIDDSRTRASGCDWLKGRRPLTWRCSTFIKCTECYILTMAWLWHANSVINIVLIISSDAHNASIRPSRYTDVAVMYSRLATSKNNYMDNSSRHVSRPHQRL